MHDNEESLIDAAEFVEAVQAFARRIPDFRPLKNDQVIAMRKAASLDPEWVTQAIGALGASPTVQHAVGAEIHELLSELQEANRWDEAESHLSALLHGVAGANLVRRHRLGVKALQIYGIARLLIRRPEHADLIPFVEQLQEMNKLGKRKKKVPAATAE